MYTRENACKYFQPDGCKDGIVIELIVSFRFVLLSFVIAVSFAFAFAFAALLLLLLIGWYTFSLHGTLSLVLHLPPAKKTKKSYFFFASFLFPWGAVTALSPPPSAAAFFLAIFS